MDGIEIAFQNKDITSKVLAENFKGKTFRVYGLDLPEVRQILPTNIPTVKANELRLDNLFELADGSVAIIDYESEYNKNDKVKYLNYLTGVANRYLKEKKECPVLRMVVIYTGDIIREQVSCTYNIGAVKMEVECAYLSELNSEEIFHRLKSKVEQNERLDDEELMEIIIFPLSYRNKEDKQENIRRTIELAAHITDRSQQLFALAGILAFTDKIIDHAAANQIRRAIEMTQVAQIFEEEKRQALTQVAQIFEEEKRQAAQIYEAEKRQAEKQAAKTAYKKVVIRMIRKDYSTEEIASLVSAYSQDDVEELRKEVEAEGN